MKFQRSPLLLSAAAVAVNPQTLSSCPSQWVSDWHGLYPLIGLGIVERPSAFVYQASLCLWCVWGGKIGGGGRRERDKERETRTNQTKLGIDDKDKYI